MMKKPRFKFRICHTAQNGCKTVHYDNNQFIIGLDGQIYQNYANDWKNPVWAKPFDSVEPPILQQFTGATDKNDRFIYEGDIVKCKRFYLKPMVKDEHGNYHSSPDDWVETEEELGVVFFSSVRLGWSIAYRRYDDYDDLSHFCAPHRIEVMGNSFEHGNSITGWDNNIWSL